MNLSQILLTIGLGLAAPMLSISCNSSRSSAPASTKTMQIEDVSTVLGKTIDLDEKAEHSGSSGRFLLKIPAAEYPDFVDYFTSELESLGRNSFAYKAVSISATKHDDNLSYFSIALGKKNTHDITISGTYDSKMNRLLIRIYTTQA